MLDRYLLRYFLAVVDQGSFTRAAARCNVSQPTLSVGIAKLEAALKASLFVRSSQRVELTAAGTRFLAHARRIEREFNEAMQSMAVADALPGLRVGVLSSIPGALVATALAASRPERRHRFELLFGGERELTGHLAKGRIDVALTLVGRGVGRGVDRFAERAVRTEPYLLTMAADHPLAEAGEIDAERLGGEAMIVRRHCEALSDTSRFFIERGIRPSFTFRSTNDERVLQMVAAGLGITVMPQCYGRDGIAQPRLVGFDLTRTLGWMAGAAGSSLMHDPPEAMIAIERLLANPD